MKKLFFAVVLFCSSAFAQNNLVPVPPIFLGPSTAPRLAAGVTITFCTSVATGAPCSPLAQAYADSSNSNPINQSINPLKTDSLGNAPAFYAAPGQYSYTVTGPGITVPQGPYQITVPCIPGGTCLGVTFITDPWADIRSYGAVCNDSTDDTAALNSAIAAVAGSTKTGGTVYIPPSASGCKIAGQVTIPNDGATPPNNKPLRIMGSANGGVVQFFPDNGCNAGSTLDMTFNAATAKILTLGLGKLEIANICFKDSNTDFTPFLLTTLTVLHFHGNQVYGNTGHFPVGCCSSSPPTQDGQTGVILGGNGTSTGTGAVTDFFQGYGTSIDHNQFDYCGQCVLVQNEANSVNIESNHFFNHITNTVHGPITFNPSQLSQSAVVKGNLIEVGGSKYGVHLVRNVVGGDFDANACWDANIGVITVNCYREEPSAANSNNHFVNPQPNTNTGTLPDSITTSSSRQQNGRFLAAVNGNTCAANSPQFGASNTDSIGLSIVGGSVQVCSSGDKASINDSADGQFVVPRGASPPTVAGYGWKNGSAITPGSGADTEFTSPSADTVACGNGTAGDGSCTLQLARIQSNGGTANMGLTLKKGSGGGNYTTTSTGYTQVDGTNLTNTVTIPTGWKLFVQVNGVSFWNTAQVTCSYAIADGGATVQESLAVAAGAGLSMPFSIGTVITGDGASHTVDLRFKTGNGSDACGVLNSSSTNAATIVYTLVPSN